MQDDNQQDQQTPNLLDELGLSGLSDDQKGAVNLKIAATFQNRLFVAIADRLTGQEKAELDEIAETGDQQQIFDYLKQKLPNIDEIARQVYDDLRAEYLQNRTDIDEVYSSNQQPEEPQPDQQATDYQQ
jgi:hypothetical protein